jgi:hypothetical protein
MDLKEVVLENVGSIHRVQDTVQWKAYVYVVLNLGVSRVCWE